MKYHLHDALDETLEAIWKARERGESSVDAVRAMMPDEPVDELLQNLQNCGMAVLEDTTIQLTESGEAAARAIIRGHRLAEAMLTEILGMSSDMVEEFACHFEHCVDPEVIDSVCTLLGHPPVCPGGRPIPRGQCCKRLEREVRPIVVSITDLALGESGRVAFIRSRKHERLDRLASFGVVPGTMVQLHQRKPAYVIRIGETDLALEAEVAGEIFVRRRQNGNDNP